MIHHYILDEQGEPVPEPDFLKWGRWFDKADEERRVGATSFGDIDVSTVFLGMDHGLFSGGPPVLYETMVFAEEDTLKRLHELSEYDDRSIFTKFFGGFDIQKRYHTKQEAVQGHKNMCAFIEVCLAKGLI